MKIKITANLSVILTDEMEVEQMPGPIPTSILENDIAELLREGLSSKGDVQVHVDNSELKQL